MDVLQNASVYHFIRRHDLAEPHVAARCRSTSAKGQPRSSSASSNDDPENLAARRSRTSRDSGQLSETEQRKYVTTYQEKLARPFACFVFVLFAFPLGMRAIRGGGGTGLGFGLALAIVFVYYVIMTIVLVRRRGVCRSPGLGVDAERALQLDRPVRFCGGRRRV